MVLSPERLGFFPQRRFVSKSNKHLKAKLRTVNIALNEINDSAEAFKF